MSCGRTPKPRVQRFASCSRICKLPLVPPLTARGLSRRLWRPSGPDLRELVADPRRAYELSAAEAAALLIELASLQAAVAARLSANPAASPASNSDSDNDRLLTAEEVAERLQR